MFYDIDMYIKTFHKKVGDKIYTYQYLVRSQRVGKNVVTKILSPLGSVADPYSPASYINSLSKAPSADTVTQARLYTLPMACHLLIEKTLGLTEAIKSIMPSLTINVPLLTKLMIISRILNPESKLSLTRWYQNLYLPEKLPKTIDVHSFYKTLDMLIEHKEEIEKYLFQRLKSQQLIDADVVFYDLTSSYFEGEECEIAKFGHSRDKRSDCLQITIGLVIDKSGLPLYHEVFEGNMSDSKTVKGILDKVRNTLAIKNILFVADKGMLSPDNIVELEKLAKEDGYTYILSQSPRTGYDTLKSSLAQKDNTWEKLTEALYYTVKKGLILCYNPFTAKKAKATRDIKIEKLTDFIATELAKTTKTKRKQDKQIIHDRIIKKLHASHAGKYFNGKNDFSKKEEVIKKEELLDGVWVLTGNTKLAPEEIVEAYKQEASIESSFRVIKDVVEVRPIYHYNPQRVKAHVFICVLSYLVARLLERKTGQSIKKLKEKYMTSVILEGKQKQNMPSFLQTI